MHEVAHRVVEPVAEPALVFGRERQLVRRARDLGPQHERVLRVHDRTLGLAVGQLPRVRGVPLVELVVAGDEHRRRAPSGAAGTTGLLPHRRERPGEPVEDHGVEPADVDAELERVRGRDAEQPAARQVAFELAPFFGEVSGAIRGDAAARAPAPRLRAGAARAAATSSALRRLRVNASVWWPERTNRASRSAVSTLAERARAGVLVEQRPLPAAEHAFGAR